MNRLTGQMHVLRCRFPTNTPIPLALAHCQCYPQIRKHLQHVPSTMIVADPPEQTYTTEVFGRCLSLVETGIWNGIDKGRLRAWMNSNFTSPEQKYFAARILDALLYRSKSQTNALLKQLFQRVIPDFCRTSGLNIPHRSCLLQALRKEGPTNDPGIRIVSVETPGDPPTGSTYIVNTYARNHLGVTEDWIIRPSQVRNCVQSGISTFIFLDDFLGTGQQFLDMWQHPTLDLIGTLTNSNVVYAPLAAHEEGIRYILSYSRIIKVCCVERLSRSHSLFAGNITHYDDGKNTEENFRHFYDEYLAKKNLVIPREFLHGSGGLELAYAFEHSTPKSSIPLLWWNNSPGTFYPLFAR